jgi:hypothetical protein
MPINQSYGRELDKRTKELEKRRPGTGSQALQEQQLAQTQLQAIQNERRSNLMSERTEAAAMAQQNQLLSQAAELGVSSSTAATLGKYGLKTPPKVGPRQGREVKVTPNNITIINNTVNQAPQAPPQGNGRNGIDPAVKFKTWLTKVNLQQAEQAAKRERDYAKRESSLTRSANKMLKRIEKVGSSVAETFSPKTFGQTIGSQLKMFLLIFGMQFLTKYWDKVLNGIDWIGKTFNNFVAWLGFGEKGAAEAKAGKGLIPTIIRLLGGDPQNESVADAFKNSLKAAFDHFALKLEHMMEERGAAIKKVKFNADLSGLGGGILGGFLKDLGLENLFKGVTDYLGDILQALVDPRAGTVKKVSKNIQKKGMEGSSRHMNKTQFESESWGVDKGDLAVLDKSNKHRYGLISGAVDKQGNLTSKKGGQISQSLDIIGALRDAQQTGYVDPARFLAGLERMQNKARSSGFIAVDYEFLTTFLSVADIKRLTQAKHIRIKRYKIVKVKKDNAYGSLMDYAASAIGMGEATEGILGQMGDYAGQANKYATDIGMLAAGKNMGGVFNAATKVSSVAGKVGKFAKVAGPYGQVIGLALGVGTAAVKDLMENDNTLELVPIEDPREAYKGKVVDLYEIDETVLKQIARSFGAEKFDTSNEKLMTQVRDFMYRKAGGVNAVKSRYKGRGSNESINIGKEYKEIHDFDSRRAAFRAQENSDEWSQRKARSKAQVKEIKNSVTETAEDIYTSTKDFFTKPNGEHEVLYDPAQYANTGSYGNGYGPRTSNVTSVAQPYRVPPTPKYGDIDLYSGRGPLRSPLSTEYTFSTEAAAKEAERLCKLVITDDPPSKWASKSATAKGKSSYLATYTRLAVAKGLGKNDLPERPRIPCEFADILYKYGFAPIGWNGYSPKKGDICVFGPTPNYSGGYSCIYSGSKWISDFEQSEMWPSDEFKSNRSATIFRHLKTISDKSYTDLLKDQYDVDAGYGGAGFIDFNGDGKWDTMKTEDGSFYKINEDGSLEKLTAEQVNSMWNSNSVFASSTKFGDSDSSSLTGYVGGTGPSHYDAWTLSKSGFGSNKWANAVMAVGAWYKAHVSAYRNAKASGCQILGGGYYRPDCSGFVSACLVLYGIQVYDPKSSSGNAGPCARHFCGLEPAVSGSLKAKMEEGGFTLYERRNLPGGLQPWDIRANYKHIEISADGKDMVYNAGSTRAIKGMPSNDSPFSAKYTHVWRCTSTPSHVGKNSILDSRGDSTFEAWNAPAGGGGGVTPGNWGGFGGGSFGGGGGGGEWTGQAAGGAPTTGGKISSEQAKQNAISIVNFLMSKGLTKEQAIGIAGNIMGESGFNPSAIGDGGTSGGFAQWHAGRFAALKRFAAAMGKDWRDPQAQMEYLWHELNTTEKNTLNKLRQAGSIEEASRVWGHEFERFRGYQNYGTAEYAKRAGFARSVAETYGSYGEERGINFAGGNAGASSGQQQSSGTSSSGQAAKETPTVSAKEGEFITFDKNSVKRIEAMADDQLAAQIWLNNDSIRKQYAGYGFEKWKKLVFDKKSRREKQKYLVEEEGKNILELTSTSDLLVREFGSGVDSVSGLGNILGKDMPEWVVDPTTGKITEKGKAWFASVYAKLSPSERKDLASRLQLEKDWNTIKSESYHEYLKGTQSDEDKEGLNDIFFGTGLGTNSTDLFKYDPELASKLLYLLKIGDKKGFLSAIRNTGLVGGRTGKVTDVFAQDETAEDVLYKTLFGDKHSSSLMGELASKAFASKQYEEEQEKINNIVSSDSFKKFTSLLTEEDFIKGNYDKLGDHEASDVIGHYVYSGGETSGFAVDKQKILQGFTEYLNAMYDASRSKYVQQNLTNGFESIESTDTAIEAFEKQQRNQKRAEINQKKYDLQYRSDHWQEDYDARMQNDPKFRQEMLWKYGIGHEANESYRQGQKGQDEVKALNDQIAELNNQLDEVNGNTVFRDAKAIKQKFLKTKEAAANGAAVDPEEIRRIDLFMESGTEYFDRVLNEKIAKIDKDHEGDEKFSEEDRKKAIEEAKSELREDTKARGSEAWDALTKGIIDGSISLEEARVILDQQGISGMVTNEQLRNIKKNKKAGAQAQQVVQEYDENGNLVTKFLGADGKEIMVEDDVRDEEGNLVIDKKTGKVKKKKRGLTIDDTEEIQKYMQNASILQGEGMDNKGVTMKTKEGDELELVRLADGTQYYLDPKTNRLVNSDGTPSGLMLKGDASKVERVHMSTFIQDQNVNARLASKEGINAYGVNFNKDNSSVDTKQFDMSKYETKEEMMKGLIEVFGDSIGEGFKKAMEEKYEEDAKAKVEVSTISANGTNDKLIQISKNGQVEYQVDGSLTDKALNSVQQRAKELGFYSDAAKTYAENLEKEKKTRAELQRRLAEGSLTQEAATNELLLEIKNEVSLIKTKANGGDIDNPDEDKDKDKK